MNRPEPSPVERISLKTILESTLQVLNLEKGMGYTIKQLIFRPARTVEEFLFVDRTRLTKPFQLLVLLVAVATYITLQFIPSAAELTAQLKASPQWTSIPTELQNMLLWFSINLRQYFNLLYISSLPLISLATYWLFRSSRLNFAEHLVINTYLFAIQTLIYILTIAFVFRYSWVGIVQSVFMFGYTVFAYQRIFQEKFSTTFLKAIAVHFLSQLLSVLILGMIGGILFLFG